MIEDVKGGAVLIVEDEPLIGAALKDTLEDAGFQVVTVTEVDIAFATLELNRARDFVALITDINLGGARTGWDVASRAREMNPALAVVYMSGDSAGDWRAHGVPQSTILEKPFALSQAVVAIASLLNHSDLDG